MPGREVSGVDAAQEVLIQSARRFHRNAQIVPSVYRHMLATDIYDYFMMSWGDHKGNAALAYGSIGTNVGIAAGFDFGVLLLPGILQLSVNVAANQLVAEEALFLIHRAMPDKWISQASRTRERRQVLYHVDQPVTFLSLAGYRMQYDIKLAAAASIGIGSVVDGLGGSYPLGAFGITLQGLDLSGQYTTAVFRYKDEQPGLYRHGRDPRLLTDFTAALGERHTHYLKRDAVDWLKWVRKKHIDPLAGNVLTNPLKKVFFNLPGFRFPGFVASTTAVKDKLREIDQVLKTPGHGLQDPVKTRITDRIGRIYRRIQDAERSQQAYRIPTKSARVPDALAVKDLCYLTLSNKKKTGQFKYSILNSPADGAMGGGTGIGKNLAGNPDGESYEDKRLVAVSSFTVPSITIGGGYTLRYSVCRTTYRYQTYALNRRQHPLVYTQDVQVRYQEKDITAAMQFGLDLLAGRDLSMAGIHVQDKALRRKKSLPAKLLKGKSWTDAQMVYRAVNVYWDQHLASGNQKAEVLNGSGVSFGYSMRLDDLLRISREENAGLPAATMNAKVAHYAKFLRVKPEEFRSFARSLLIRGERSRSRSRRVTGFENYEDYGAVLVEASFRIKDAQSVSKAQAKDGSYSDTDLADLTDKVPWQDFFYGKSDDRDAAGLELETIRVRLRLGDHVSNTRNVFRLGLYLFGAGVSFNIDKVEAAGNEGILTLHSHSFLNIDKHPRRTASALRDGVPPVMLMPHSFNE